MNNLPSLLTGRPLTRRDFLCRSGMGMASLGLAGLLASQGLAAAPDGAVVAAGAQGAALCRPRPSASFTCS